MGAIRNTVAGMDWSGDTATCVVVIRNSMAGLNWSGDAGVATNRNTVAGCSGLVCQRLGTLLLAYIALVTLGLGWRKLGTLTGCTIRPCSY